jgi:hypothetical protein
VKAVARVLRAATLAAALAIPLSAAGNAPRLTIARLQYDGGGDWYANPSSIRTCSPPSASAPRCRWSAPRRA